MEQKTEKPKVKELEKEKERMIHRYLGLQDQADALNEQIYHLCCDIEILNKRIEIAKEEEAKKKAKEAAVAAAKAAQNGSSSNGNGAGHASDTGSHGAK